MQREDITTLFDQQASLYDQQWRKMAPINSALHLLTDAVLSDLSPTANILCIGVGTGAEIVHLAKSFPTWRFTAVEPSILMLEVFRRKAEEHGILSRCVIHEGYLDSLPLTDGFDGATAFLVSQFIEDREARTAFFQDIADRLLPDGILVNSDLAGELSKIDCQGLLRVWFKLMSGSGISDEGVQRMRQAYSSDVAVLPPHEVQDMIGCGGFTSPVLFYQAGLIHAWYARRTPKQAE